MCSSYHTPNHHTNAKANSGDFVREIVAKRAHHEEQQYHESCFRTGPQSGGACHNACFRMRVIAHIPAIVAFRMREVERADAKPAPRQVEEPVGGGRTAECGE
jgi:hypothetical protein